MNSTDKLFAMSVYTGPKPLAKYWRDTLIDAGFDAELSRKGESYSVLMPRHEYARAMDWIDEERISEATT